MAKIAKKIRETYRVVAEDDDDEPETAWDDSSGVALRPIAVRAARVEETSYVRKVGLYTKVPVKERLVKTGKHSISASWIDISKGDATNPNFRSIWLHVRLILTKETISVRRRRHSKH